MTNEEMKKALAKGGVTAADIEKVSEKFDAEKITEIVEAASTPKEALEALHAFYPELEVEKMQEQMDFVQSQFEAAMKGQRQENAEPMELTEKELDMVSGGGIGDWFKKNWKKVAVGAAIVVGAALIATGVGALAGVALETTFVAASNAYAVYGIGTAAAAAAGAGVGAVIGTVCGVDTVIEAADQLPS